MLGAARRQGDSGEIHPPPVLEEVATTALQFTATQNVGLPAGAVPGDLLVVIAAAASATPTLHSGAGWSVADQLTAGTGVAGVLVAFKILDGNDSLVIGQSSAWRCAVALRISGATKVQAVHVSGDGAEHTPPFVPSPRARLSVAALAWYGDAAHLESYPSTHPYGRTLIAATGGNRPNLAVCAADSGIQPAPFVLSAARSANAFTVDCQP